MSTEQNKYYDNGLSYSDDSLDARLTRVIEFLRQALPVIELDSSSRVLDIGCANGMVLRSLPENIRRTGVDVAGAPLQRAEQAGIETVVCDFDNNPLPFPAGQYNLVLCNDVIEHVLHTDHLMNEINRVLKPGGHLVISIPNVNQPVSFVMQFILDFTPMYAARYRGTHYRDFSDRLFGKILSVHGFDLIRKEGSFIYPAENNRVSQLIAKLLPRWGAQILYFARKNQNASIADDFAANMPELQKWFKNKRIELENTTTSG
ncbi:MAG: class I SAM-dependent methyltransferase [Kiritimatiellae bacterium]|nr:class I SAM-dependent methyltransferase [Kiritimatiellia bacterium]